MSPTLQRRAWLALWLQDRRRTRAAADFLALTSDGHGRLTWRLAAPSSLGFNIYKSVDGVAWGTPYATAIAGATSRDCSGVVGYFRLCQRDGGGNDVLPFSNVVRSDGL